MTFSRAVPLRAAARARASGIFNNGFLNRGCSRLTDVSSSAPCCFPCGSTWAVPSACQAGTSVSRFGARRGFASHKYPEGLERGLKDTTNIPVGGENLYRRVGGPGYPMMFDVKYDKPTWQPLWEDEHEVIPRDGYGCVHGPVHEDRRRC